MIIVERTWEVNGLIILKSFKADDNGKKIPDTTVYSVDEIDGDNLNCFASLAEARKYAKEF